MLSGFPLFETWQTCGTVFCIRIMFLRDLEIIELYTVSCLIGMGDKVQKMPMERIILTVQKSELCLHVERLLKIIPGLHA